MKLRRDGARGRLTPGQRVTMAMAATDYGHLRRFWPRTDPVDVIVVSSYREAEVLGYRRTRYGMRDGDRMVVSVAAGPRAIEGLRVGEIEWTGTAWRAPGAQKLDVMLRRNQLKSSNLGRTNNGSR